MTHKHDFKAKWRRLEKGEVVQAGDEYDACVDGWRDPANWVPVKKSQIGVIAPGQKYPDHRQFRRSVI